MIRPSTIAAQWCEAGHDVTQHRQYQSDGPKYFRDSDETDQGTGQAFDACLPARDQLLFGLSGFHHARKKKQDGQQALGYPQHRIHVLASPSHIIVSTTHHLARTSLEREQLFLAV